MSRHLFTTRNDSGLSSRLLSMGTNCGKNNKAVLFRGMFFFVRKKNQGHHFFDGNPDGITRFFSSVST
jgi:hypothetical protein